jgi:hypothetical protein
LDEPAAHIAAHLAACESCRAEARRLGAAWALMNIVEPRRPSSQFAQGVWHKIAETETSSDLPRSGRPVWSLRWAAAGLAVVLAATVPVAVWYQDPPERPEIVAQLDLMESRELLTDLEVVRDLDVLLLLDDP